MVRAFKHAVRAGPVSMFLASEAAVTHCLASAFGVFETLFLRNCCKRMISVWFESSQLAHLVKYFNQMIIVCSDNRGQDQTVLLCIYNEENNRIRRCDLVDPVAAKKM